MINDMTNPFEAALGTAQETAAKKDGMTIHVVSGNVNGSISISAEISEIEDFISEHVNLILVCPSDPNAIVPVIKKANAAGIPVIAVNSGVGSGAKVVTFIGANNYTYGVAQAELTDKALGGKGTVALLQGVLGDSPEVLRTQGFEAQMKKYPNITIVAEETDNWINSDDIADVQDLVAKYPVKGELGAIVAQGPEIYAGANWAVSHGHTGISYIGGDYTTELKASIVSGAVYGTVNQSPAEQGQLSVEYAYDWLTGHHSAVVQPISYTGLPLVTESNVATTPAQWSS
jgi:ribose transport system substrate-binding protein